MGETRGTIEALRRGAAECEAAGVAGWGNTMATAADALLAAIARAEAAERARDVWRARFEDKARFIREQVRSYANDECREARHERDDLQREVQALAAENARLREALEWYAAPATWQPGFRITSMGHHHASAGEIDGGQRARAALRAQPGEETSG